MNTVGIFDHHRGHMFSIAYRMLGNVDDAEDVIQDAFLRWSDKGSPKPDAPRAYFTTVISRLCIDYMRAARSRRQGYTGPWLPEPLSGEESGQLPDPVEREDSLSIAFMAILERLAPLERAVFLLRQAFDYEYTEIAAIVERPEAHCRQLFSRARKRVASDRPRFRASRQQHAELLKRFVDAYREGDMAGLLAVLATDSELVADGGGQVAAAPEPIRSAEAVADFLVRIHRHAFSGLRVAFVPVNGELSLVLSENGQPRTVIAIESDGERIRGIYVQRNPEKLRYVTA